MKPTLHAAGFLGVAVLLAGPIPTRAAADVNPTLEQRVEQLDQELRVLRRQLEIDREEREKQALADQEKGVKVTHNGRSVKLASNDGSFEFKPGGRVQVDYAHYGADQQPLGDGTAIRRARLSAEGKVFRVWDYKVEYEFSSSNASDAAARGIRDAYLRYTGFNPVLITVGNFKQPFSFEQVTSDSAVTFLERSLIDVFAPSRYIGAAVQTSGANWSLTGGLFGERPEDDVAAEGDEGYDLTARGTWAPFWDTGRVLHLGAAVRRSDPQESTNGLRWRARPESNITDVRLVDTGVLTGTDEVFSYGLEAAGALGPWSLQGEYIGTQVNRSGASDVDLGGWYVLASWIITGETRPYKVNEGVFDRIVPTRIVGQGGIGAWELALRLSDIDLTDGLLVGGEQRNVSFGLNWHLTPNVKLQANYIKVLDLDRPGNAADGDEPSVYTVRAQVDF